MGCSSSKRARAVDDGGTLHIVFARAIAVHARPNDEHRKLLQENSVECLRHPAGEPERSLLVLALKENKLDWFRLLLDKCDPHVTWTQDGRPIDIRNLLRDGDACYEWRAAQTRWDMAQQSKERAITAEPMVEWRALFPLAAKALGAAAVAAGVMAASLPGFGVGFSICAEICKAFTEWTSTSSEFKASVEVARKMKEALQDTLDLEDERIANAQYSRNTTYKRSVESNSQLLRIILDRQSERMRKELLKRSTTQSHKDTMMEDMLGELLDRQAKVMKAYTNEKILYQLKSLSSRINPNRGGGNGAPTPSDLAEGDEPNNETNETIRKMLRGPRAESEAHRSRLTAKNAGNQRPPPPYNDRPDFSECKTVAESEPSVYNLKGENAGSGKGTAQNASPQLQQILPLLLTFLDSRSWCGCLAVNSAAHDAVRALFSGLMTDGPRPEEGWTVPLDVLTLKTDEAGIVHLAANECGITVHGSAANLEHLRAVIVPPPQSGFITVEGEQYIATSPILRCRWTGTVCSQGPWTVSFPLEEEDGLSNPTELSRVLRRGDGLREEWEVQAAGLKASLRYPSMQAEVTHFSDVVTADKLREIEKKWAKSYYERKRWWGAPSFSRHAHVYNASSEEMTVLQELPPRLDAERGVQVTLPVVAGGGGGNRAYTTPDGNARERALLPLWPNAKDGNGNEPPAVSAKFRTLPGAGEMCVVPYTVRGDSKQDNLKVFPRDFFRCLAGYDYYLLQKMLDVRARYRERDVEDLNEEETVMDEVKPRR